MKPTMQVVVVGNMLKGIDKAKEELYLKTDNKTVLFLSGGKTPKSLYQVLAREKIIKPAAVALIDERFGKHMHNSSNEKMISDTGLLDYFATKKIPWYPVLQFDNGKKKIITIEDTVKAYDEIVRKLFFHFPKSIGIVGIGSDGHTAGIAPDRKDFANPIFASSQKHMFVSYFNDKKGKFGQRITLTFAGLSLLDRIIVFVFGKDKKNALEKAFTQGDLKEIPARFYQTSEIAKKTIFITDQKI